MMLKRYQEWTAANPLLDWLISVAVGLVVFLGLYQIIPGQKKPGVMVLIVVIVLSGPTTSLMRRFSDERRQADPISAFQEQGVGVLAILASVCCIGAFALCILGGRWRWPVDRTGPLLMAWSVLTLLSLGLGQAARFTTLGRWGLRLTVGWFALMILGAVIRLILLAVRHP